MYGIILIVYVYLRLVYLYRKCMQIYNRPMDPSWGIFRVSFPQLLTTNLNLNRSIPASLEKRTGETRRSLPILGDCDSVFSDHLSITCQVISRFKTDTKTLKFFYLFPNFHTVSPRFLGCRSSSYARRQPKKKHNCGKIRLPVDPPRSRSLNLCDSGAGKYQHGG